ncbi:hypothetical protein BC830DRAFT_1165141 [Chytriomyces sp. MP71]|nr:hypothetical protein BC830DRAFT_1165141 [Chytriomyces sp. MP71]
MDQRHFSEPLNTPRIVLHLSAKAAPSAVPPRPPPSTSNQSSKPKKFVCANCETSIASSWRRSATHGPDQWLCNSCSVYYRMKGVQRPKDLRRDVVDKRLSTGASYKKMSMKRKRTDPRVDGLTFRPGGGVIAKEAKRIVGEHHHHQHGHEDYRAFLTRLNLPLSPEMESKFANAAKQYIATRIRTHHDSFTSSQSAGLFPLQSGDCHDSSTLESTTSSEPSMRVPEMAPSAESDPSDSGGAPLSPGSMQFGALLDIRYRNATGPVFATGSGMRPFKVPDAMVLEYTLWAFDELERLGVDLSAW